MNTDVHLIRVDTGQEIPCTALSASIDHRSWLWSVDASILGDSALFEPEEPVEIQGTWNGYPVRALVEILGTNRSFGLRSATLRGRSPVAVLSDPYAATVTHTNTEARTAQQLVLDALEFTGVTLDWQLTDWLVPTGAWSFLGTAGAAVQQIVGSAAGIVQADPTADQLHVLPYYPIAPWDWDTATPDVVVPLDAVVTEGVEWRTIPAYNRAFISGQTQGVLGQVTRAGTAGDKSAPMITDPLITHADTARQHGLAVLGDTGRQAWITLGMPISGEIPLLAVGQLIELQESAIPAWRGLVRGVRLSATKAGDAVTVRQSVTLERHLEAA